ncbi:hypothetical protein SFC76_16530 [Sphingomonas sp. CD22]|uniref:hypothetical protein n=1 Tax=Sphingomonas sp. CD22 TaxID=3100214 RepID=UPI002AE09360|nr:hypothetical protein [Sphingomonas sp. CD22]MEA1085873.1 hypothetical protein [Sphingomonas sp. CD22]
MNQIRLLALAPLLMIGACALGTAHNVFDDNTVVMTRVAANQLAACLGEAVGVTPAPDGTGGFRVDMPAAAASNSFLVVRKDEVTTVEATAPREQMPSSQRKIAIDCAIKLAPHPN